jgi:hypothetical protein
MINKLLEISNQVEFPIQFTSESKTIYTIYGIDSDGIDYKVPYGKRNKLDFILWSKNFLKELYHECKKSCIS